jgi:hypothetical protein
VVDVLDITPSFLTFARKAGLESPLIREQLWRELYVDAHPDVFDGFFSTHGAPEGAHAVVRQLSKVRARIEEAREPVRAAVEDLDPIVQESLGIDGDEAPLHVLMVGTLSANAAVGRVEGRVALFHCLEWFQSAAGSRTLVAHEGTHAWHEIALGSAGPQEDLAWMTFYEGLALRASREIVPGRPEDEYFWYGHEGFEEWLPWCKEQRSELISLFRGALDDPAGVEQFFGSGLVEGRWRTGFFVADFLVGKLERSLDELAAMSVEEAARAIRELLENDELVNEEG